MIGRASRMGTLSAGIVCSLGTAKGADLIRPDARSPRACAVPKGRTESVTPAKGNSASCSPLRPFQVRKGLSPRRGRDLRSKAHNSNIRRGYVAQSAEMPGIVGRPEGPERIFRNGVYGILQSRAFGAAV